jgi:hypothetical protein
VHRLLESHRSGKEDNHKLLFSLAMFEQWLRGLAAGAGSMQRQQPMSVTCRE